MSRSCRDCGEAVEGRRWKCDDCKALAKGPREPSAAVSREREALRLRASGRTFDQIAEELGYADESGAWRAYKRAMGRAGRDRLSVADRRELTLHRLDLAINAVWDQVERGDLAAVDRIERLEKLRTRLEGMALATGVGTRSGFDDDNDASGDGTVIGENRLQQLREKRERDAADRTAGT